MSIFIVIGALLVLGFAFIALSPKVDKSSGDTFSLDSDTSAIQEMVEVCAGNTLRDAINKEGPKDLTVLESYINNNLESCIDFDTYVGLNILSESPSAKIDRSEDEENLVLRLEYPISISRGTSSNSLRNYILEFTVADSVELEYGDDNRTLYTRTLISPNGLLKLKIPAGTLVTNENGRPDEIKIMLLDSEEFTDDYANSRAHPVVYKFSPHETFFDPGIEVEIKYEEENIPRGIFESKLKVSTYEVFPYGNYWVNHLDNEVDSTNNVVTARVEHFSNVSVTGNRVCYNRNNESVDCNTVTECFDGQNNSIDCKVTESGNYGNSPTTCKSSMPSIIKVDDWCTIDCNTGQQCADGRYNCDCYSSCGQTTSADGCNARAGESLGGGGGPSTGPGFQTENSGGTATGSRHYHHWNTNAWHEKGGVAMVLCRDSPRFSSCVTSNGKGLYRHGSQDKGRDVWTNGIGAPRGSSFPTGLTVTCTIAGSGSKVEYNVPNARSPKIQYASKGC